MVLKSDLLKLERYFVTPWQLHRVLVFSSHTVIIQNKITHTLQKLQCSVALVDV